MEEPDPQQHSFHQALPAELLCMVVEHLEYASDVNALSQTCHHLHAIANTRLSSYYIPRYSPRGLYRAITSGNALAVRRLCALPKLSWGDYCKIYPEPIVTAAEHGFLEIVKLLSGESGEDGPLGLRHE